MSDKNKTEVTARLAPSFITWLGGALWMGHQPGMGFWDGIIWMYYVGRYIAAHFTMLHY